MDTTFSIQKQLNKYEKNMNQGKCQITARYKKVTIHVFNIFDQI